MKRPLIVTSSAAASAEKVTTWVARTPVALCKTVRVALSPSLYAAVVERFNNPSAGVAVAVPLLNVNDKSDVGVAFVISSPYWFRTLYATVAVWAPVETALSDRTSILSTFSFSAFNVDVTVSSPFLTEIV